jgi:hypothetical protein
MKRKICRSILTSSTSICERNGANTLLEINTKEEDCDNETKQNVGKKKVSFGYVRVREYGVTVGSYTASTELCPIQLTWEHSEEMIASLNLLDKVYSQGNYILSKLTSQQRRERIAKVQGLSTEIVTKIELEQLMLQIKSELATVEHIRDRCRQNSVS